MTFCLHFVIILIHYIDYQKHPTIPTKQNLDCKNAILQISNFMII